MEPTPSTSVQITPAKTGRKPTNRQAYTEHEIRLALEMTAICAGNAAEASRRLAERRGMKIPHSTIKVWLAGRYAAQYEAIQHEVRDQIDRHVVAEARDLVTELAHLERLAMSKAVEQLEAGQIRDASAVLRNATVSKGINMDKVSLHEGRPTTIIENRTGEETLRALAAMGRLTVDSTAEEG